MPATLGLSTYRWNNNIKSVLLLLAFPLLLLALVGGIFYVYGWFILDPQYNIINPNIMRNFGFDPSACGPYYTQIATSNFPACRPEDMAFAAIYAWWPIITGIATIWTLIGYFFNDSIIHMATGAVPVTRQENPKLYNTLENLCISRGLRTPNLYIIETDAMNAYASGIDEKSYAITVTTGLLQRLNDKEIEAVLGHELTHIINRDCRLLIVTVVFVGMISFAAQLLWRSLRVVSYSRSNRREQGGGGVMILILIAAIASFIGYLLALILRFALSRRREYLADAGSVELTKNPEALISALKKISSNCDVPHVPSEVRQMFIENPPGLLGGEGLFATHPPIQDRIHVLEELGGLPPAPPAGHSMIPET
jgi:heat shock protein HtpX